MRRLAILAVLLGVTACNPVETWRDMTGASRDDPDPDTTPNTRNLAAGEAADYPNLATVPAPPTRAMTAAEREKLTQSLIADRANAKYTAEQLRAGFPAAAPPPTSSSVAESDSAQSTLVSSPASPSGPAPDRVPATAATPERTPVTSPAAPTPAAVAARNAEGAAATAAITAPAAQSAGRGVAAKKPAGPGQGLRKQGEPAEPAPMESSLEVPQARATPEPEQIQAAPPPPQLPPTPRVASTTNTLPGGLAAGGALAPISSSGAKDASAFQPAPPPPELPPLPRSPSAAVEPAKASPKPPASVGTPVAEIKFGADATSLTENDRRKLENVVPLYREKLGKVRIVGYAAAGSGAAEQLNSYRTALDRAQAVAAALTEAGIPSDKIQVEAAPAGTNSGESRAEVLLGN